MGRQFFRNCLGLSPFGSHVIIPCLCVTENVPLWYPSFIERLIKCLKSLKKNLKNSTVKPSEPGLLLFFIFRSTLEISSAVISPSRLDDSISVRTGCCKLFKISWSFISVLLLSGAYKFEINCWTSFKIPSRDVIALPFSCCTFGIVLLTTFLDSKLQKYRVGFSPSSAHLILALIIIPWIFSLRKFSNSNFFHWSFPDLRVPLLQDVLFRFLNYVLWDYFASFCMMSMK